MASPWYAAAWPALQVGAMVNVSAMIVLGSAGALLADPLTEEGYRVAYSHAARALSGPWA